jgi:hypothetical protein
MARRDLSPERIMTMLAAAPLRMAELAASLSPEQLRTAPAPSEWSMVDVLAHLRACADQWGGSIEAMLAEDRPTLRAINPRSWIKQTDYPTLDFQPSFDAYAAQRTQLLAILESLEPAQWSRISTMTGAGAPLTRSIQGQAERIAIHERPHLKQMARIAEAVRAT